MNAPALPLTGARKKAEPTPRTEGVMVRRRKTGTTRIYYARLYPDGAKRAVYRSTHATTVAAAASVLPALRAAVSRGSATAVEHINAEQLPLLP